MNRLFGVSKKQQPPKPEPKKQQPKEEEKPITLPEKPKVSLGDQQSRLQNKVRQLSETVSRLDAEAKDLLEKSKKSKGTAKQMYKQRCVQVLKKRKLYDNQLKNYMSQQFTLDQVAFTSQNIQNTLEMGEMMKQAVTHQQDVMKNLDMDELDDIRDQMDELKYDTQYMNEMLNRDYDCDIDEDDLDDQLGMLEKELKADKQKQKQPIQGNNQQMNSL